MEHVNGIKGTITAVLAALTALWGWFGWFTLAWVACMVIDYATGSAAAMKMGEWSSRAAREGIWHKVGSMAAVIIAGILDLVVGLMVNHIPSITMVFTYTVFVCPLVMAWYILTEIGSVIENAGKLGAQIPPWLAKMVEALKGGVEVAGDKLDKDTK